MLRQGASPGLDALGHLIRFACLRCLRTQTGFAMSFHCRAWLAGWLCAQIKSALKGSGLAKPKLALDCVSGKRRFSWAVVFAVWLANCTASMHPALACLPASFPALLAWLG